LIKKALSGMEHWMDRSAIACSIVVCLMSGTWAAAGPPAVDKEGTAHLPALSVPESSLLSDDTRAALQRARDSDQQNAASLSACPSIESADAAQAPAIRQCQADAYTKFASYQRLRDRYPVAITSEDIGGIPTEVFTPWAGVAPRNQRRVLINVHGGGFMMGAHLISHLESIPIASMGKIKVISIDYREAPEFSFPAASEDLAAVYRALLKTYQPKNIGIYGCSAGGLLTAEAIAWLQKEKLPQPGAVGMFCEGADYWAEGDSGTLGKALNGGVIWGSKRQNPYFKATDPNDPLAFPVRSAAVMAKFPPSLLITASRDPALSSVVYTHSVLIRLGVETELHVWEGLGHAFFFDPDIAESREVYAVAVKFFDTHLGRH
jgi:monoterpene epsilon-lactone hydrolase